MTFNSHNSNKHIPFIIAEIGINHNGDINIAKKLIKMAYTSGCSAVKFQKRNIDEVYTQEYLAGHRESPWGVTQREQKEGLEFGEFEYDEIDRFCKNLGILWTASCWDLKSQKFLQSYDVAFNKIASPMITHKHLLETVAKEGKNTYISTGMSTFHDIDRAVEIFERYNCPFTLLHCVSKYPLGEGDSNLSMMISLRERYACPIGYSGHEKGVLTSVLAVALGATAIERHVTLDRTMYGSDQSASLEKKGLKLMVRDIRRIPQIMGDGKKRILPEEQQCADKLRYFNREDFSWDPENDR
jgi:N-acetylneuraminate synthase